MIFIQCPATHGRSMQPLTTISNANQQNIYQYSNQQHQQQQLQQQQEYMTIDELGLTPSKAVILTNMDASSNQQHPNYQPQHQYHFSMPVSCSVGAEATTVSNHSLQQSALKRKRNRIRAAAAISVSTTCQSISSKVKSNRRLRPENQQLSIQDKLNIIEMRERTKKSYRELAREFNCTSTTILYTIKNKDLFIKKFKNTECVNIDLSTKKMRNSKKNYFDLNNLMDDYLQVF